MKVVNTVYKIMESDENKAYIWYGKNIFLSDKPTKAKNAHIINKQREWKFSLHNLTKRYSLKGEQSCKFTESSLE